ncbi:hypothetical protein Rcae01_05538 [Novipirellula caenicola]|uniref:Uncharacterized protein n=2 Tax=Novipirellula caenicola TaxID=1536901 RepID=A0ABP9VY25_9BACT
MHRDPLNLSHRINAGHLATAKKLIRKAQKLEDHAVREQLTQEAIDTIDGELIDIKVDRLILRPLVGCEKDKDLHLGLEKTVAGILGVTHQHMKISTHDDTLSVYAVFFGSYVFRRSIIIWLAQRAMKNKWSLVEHCDAI